MRNIEMLHEMPYFGGDIASMDSNNTSRMSWILCTDHRVVRAMLVYPAILIATILWLGFDNSDLEGLIWARQSFYFDKYLVMPYGRLQKMPLRSTYGILGVV